MNIARDHFLNSAQGQLSLRHRRQRQSLFIDPINIEPKSKNSITHNEKLAFQTSLLGALTQFHRNYFRSPVALELDFFPTKNDPPAVHTMAKNYLDLLQAPVKGLQTQRKRLILEDDRQVRYLAVKYHISSDNNTPSIWVKVAPYSALLGDAALLHKVQYDKLRDDRGNAFGICSASSSWDELVRGDRDYHGDASDRLRDLESDRISWVSRFGKDVYDAWHEMLLREAQADLLKALSLSPNGLVQLLAPLFANELGHFEESSVALRGMLISPRFAIDLRHSHLKEGESPLFRQLVRDAIGDFRKRFKRLFPLRAQAGATILFQPPATGGIDLDNLARRIIPFVNDELQPPSNLVLTVDAAGVKDAALRRWFTVQQERLKRMPRYSVTHYQVVQLPRLSMDDKHGFVRLMLEPGEQFETLWGHVEGLADKWQERVERR